MKLLPSIFFLLLLPGFCFGQFYVVKVSGKVFADDKLMQPRLKLDQESVLKFSNEQAFAHVISPSQGHFILDGRKAKRNQRGEFLSALKDALVPPHQFEAAATRSTELAGQLSFADEYELKAWFRGDILFLDRFTIELDEAYFGPAEDLVISVEHQARKPLPEHEILATEKVFHLTAQIFNNARSRNRAKLIETSTLTVKNREGKTLYTCGPFVFQHLKKKHRKQLKKEVDILASLLEVEDQEVFCQEHLLPFLALHYGKASHESAHQLLALE